MNRTHNCRAASGEEEGEREGDQVVDEEEEERFAWGPEYPSWYHPEHG